MGICAMARSALNSFRPGMALTWSSRSPTLPIAPEASRWRMRRSTDLRPPERRSGRFAGQHAKQANGVDVTPEMADAISQQIRDT